jgi:2-methylisocitrate lyase-like PEP mutase family enzyme
MVSSTHIGSFGNVGHACSTIGVVEGGKTPPLSAAELEAIGFALVIFPGGIVRAFGHLASAYYASLAKHGSSEPFRSRMLDFAGLDELIGTPELLALGKRYAE